MEFEKQTIWRTTSHLNSGGSFVWEVLEVVGGTITDDMKRFYTECRDGSFILIQCFHFFTSERLDEHLCVVDTFLNQELIIV